MLLFNTEIPCRAAELTVFSGQKHHILGDGHAKLTCRAKGYPKPSIFWSPIPDSRRFKDNKRGTLTIKNPRIEDTGVYTCTTSNECGQKSSETKLTIIGLILQTRYYKLLLL